MRVTAVRRIVPTILLCLLFAFAASGLNCGGGGGKKAAESGAEQLAKWVGGWSDDAARGERRPPTFDIPTPPAVTLATAATQIGDDVGRARPALADLRARVFNEASPEAVEYTQGALCEWFSWYVEDPANRPVPDSERFVFLLASGALKVRLGTPVEKEVKDAAELFRKAVQRGQGLVEDTRNAAMAAACSVPVGG